MSSERQKEHANLQPTWTWTETILAVMRKRPAHRWTLTELCAEIAPLPIVARFHKEHWGARPDYRHRVRTYLVRLKARGLVERVARGTYVLAATTAP